MLCGDPGTWSLWDLSSMQALADLANFQIHKAEEMELTNGTWVAFGDSYADFLVVWLKIKYPDLFAAAVGSSTPIQAKAGFYEEYIFNTEKYFRKWENRLVSYLITHRVI